MSYAQVVFTGTVNVGNIVAAIVTLIGVMTVYFRLKIESERTRRDIATENEKTRNCIHALPYHPENPANQVNPPIE